MLSHIRSHSSEPLVLPRFQLSVPGSKSKSLDATNPASRGRISTDEFSKINNLSGTKVPHKQGHCSSLSIRLLVILHYTAEEPERDVSMR